MRALRISHSAVVTEWRRREQAIRAHGVDVHLISAARWDEGGALVELNAAADEDVRAARTFGSPRHPNLFVFDPLPLWRALGEEWDVIDIHEEPCSLASAQILLLRAVRRARAPYILYSAQNIPKRYPIPFRWWERAALRGAAAASVCNTEAAAILRAKGLTGPVRVIGLGVDVARFATDARLRSTGGVLHVGYVGRLAPHKGVDVLLDALAGEPRLRLTVAGGGPDEQRLQDRAERHDLAGRVTFLGHLAHEQLADLYRTLDVLAVPSLPTPGWREQFGRVAVEAMASGCVVVASRTGALPDVLGDAGLLVPPGDPVALRGALQTLLDEPTLAGRLRTAGRHRAAAYDWDAIGREYVDLYREAVRGSTGEVPPSVASAPPGCEGRVAPRVVVVAYGAADLLERALTPLAGHLPITVVDNSADERVRAVVDHVGAEYVDPGRNLGFAGAVNLAAALHPDGRDLLLLNPDAHIDVAGVHALHDFLRADPRRAAVAPRQVDRSGAETRVSWPFPSPRGAWLQALGLSGADRAAQFVIGSVLLLRAEALADVGPFDESFFLYAEETDWQLRAHRSGWRAALHPGVVAEHIGGGTSTDPVRRETHFHASQERYLRKHFGRRGWAAARSAVVAGGVARSLIRRGPARQSARLRVRLYLHGPLRAEAELGTAR